MNKRKILSLALGMCMVAILAVGGTLAYFVDTDAANNVFTSGDVDIVLKETFVQESKLLPSTGSAQAGTLKNGIEKDVWVENEGSEDAYVRLHIAIPQLLDDGADTFDASANILHFNFPKENAAEGLWDWSNATGAPYTGEWNYYEETINGIVYNVYVVTYATALKEGEKTVLAMDQVYLDSEVTNEDIQKLNAQLGNKWQIKIVAQGAQAAGFTNAYEALNEAFGAPAAGNVTWAPDTL